MSELVKPEGRELDTLSIREGIHSLEAKVRECADAFDTLDVMHHFTDGIYCRTVLMRAGEIIVGKIHKREHIVVVSAGRAQVISEEFGSKDIVAPMVFKSPPGVKRALLILEDMVWTTIHKNSTNTEDMAILEDELIAKDYDEVKS